MPIAETTPFVRVTEACTVCGLCEAIAPEVFHVTDRGCILKPGPGDRFREEIRQAFLLCPSGAIRIEEERHG